MWQVTASVPFEDGLLLLKQTIGRRYLTSGSVSRFRLPPSVVDRLDTLQLVAVGHARHDRSFHLGPCDVQVYA